jgi:hypothetical protein
VPPASLSELELPVTVRVRGIRLGPRPPTRRTSESKSETWPAGERDSRPTGLLIIFIAVGLTEVTSLRDGLGRVPDKYQH